MSKAVVPMTKLLTAISLSCVLLAGCTETGSNSSAQEREAGASAPTSKSSASATPAGGTKGGTKVGDAFAEGELRPVGDSAVSGNVIFKEVGSLGVQVELEVSDLQAPEDFEEPEAYFAQVHQGTCSEVPTEVPTEVPRGSGREPEDDHGDEPHGHEHGGAGPSLALLGPGPLLAKKDEYADHAEYADPPADELPGNVDTPVEVLGSSNGTATVTSLLEGVDPEDLTSGSPKYMDLRAPGHDLPPEYWPALACADLS